MADATIKQVGEYFRMPDETLSQFAAQWKTLSDKDKADIRKGLGDGTYNY